MAELGAILPVKLSGRHYADNLGLCDIMFSSFRAAGLHEVLAELLVIVPEDEVGIVEAHCRRWPDLPLRVQPEQELVPELAAFNRAHQVRPWHRQQVIKLAAVAASPFDFTLVCDPDVLAIKPMTIDDLLPGGRGLLQPESRSIHEKWWRDSAALLGVDPAIERPGIGVTPEILAKVVVQALQRHLEARHGKPWAEVLLASYETWTEYTLYAHALDHLVERTDHHVFPDELDRPLALQARNNVWDEHDLAAVDFADFFADDEPGLFAVVQSCVEVAPAALKERLDPYLPITLTSYERVAQPAIDVRDAYGKVVRAVLRPARKLLARS